MTLTLFTVLCMALLYGDSVLGVTVHFGSPGGNHGNAGVYRAVIDIDTLLESPQSEAIEMGTDFGCVSIGYTFYGGLAVRSLSYDADAGRTLLQILPMREQHSTAISDKTCSLQESFHQELCGEYSPQYRLIMRNLPTMDHGIIQPLGSSNDSLYFVYTPDGDDVVYFGYMSYLQLRKVKDGYTFPTSDYPTPIDVNSFSTIITDIRVSGRWLQAGYTLLTVPGEYDDDLVFLTVARSIVYPRPPGDDAKFSYVLVAVHGNEAKVLHMTDDTTKGWYGHSIGSEGGVSYKDGMLCWTVADSMLCGTWSPDQPMTPPADIEAVLKRGQAASVCKFSGRGSAYGNVITGVAVVDTPKKDGRLALFFGCFSTIMGKGGLGLLVRDPAKPEVDIIQVKYDEKPILAGAMFVTPDDLCSKAENKMKRLLEGLDGWYMH